MCIAHKKLFMLRALKLEAEIAAVGNLRRRSPSVCNRFMTVYSTMDYIGGGAEQGERKGRCVGRGGGEKVPFPNAASTHCGKASIFILWVMAVMTDSC